MVVTAAAVVVVAVPERRSNPQAESHDAGDAAVADAGVVGGLAAGCNRLKLGSPQQSCRYRSDGCCFRRRLGSMRGPLHSSRRR